MSLLITSSKQPRVGGTVDIGIEKPFNYINNFQNPVKIPANSEIAVESVKINRLPRIQAKDKLILGWFGKRFHQTSASSINETSEYVVPNILELNKDSSSPIEFASQLRDIFNDMYSYHPEFNVNKTEVSVSYTTTGAFAGYEVSMETCSQVAASKIPDCVMVVDPNGYDQNVDALGNPIENDYKLSDGNPILFGAITEASSSNTKLSYDPSNGSLQCRDADTISAIFPEGMWEKDSASGGGPLSLLNGSATFVVDGKNSKWWVGLVRSHSNNFKNGTKMGFDSVGLADNENMTAGHDLPGFAPGPVINDEHGETPSNPPESFVDQYYDYVVHQDGAHVRLFHSVYQDGPFGPSIIHREIKYYDAANTANSSFATGVPILVGAAPTEITFIAENDKMFIFDQNGSLITGPKVVTDDVSDCVPKPIDQGCLRLYPKVSFENASGKSIIIKKYTPRTATTSPKIWGDDWFGRCVRNEIFGQRDPSIADGVAGQLIPQKRLSPIPQWTGGAKNWPMDLVQRSYLRPDLDMGKYEYRGLSGSLGLVGKEIINIVGSDSPYTDAPYGNDGKLESQPNMGPQVGSKFSSVWPEGVTFSGSFSASFSTAGVPISTADRAAYIRVPTLSHQSFNGATGNQSKILFQVPKFDNAGNDTGALQFQAQDRLYLDLKNGADINLTDINVQFVSSDEKFSDDLTGQSSVLFHIRPKM